MTGQVKVIRDLEHGGLHVRVLRDDSRSLVRYVAVVYVPEGADAWCAGYWDRFASGYSETMAWHYDTRFGAIGFGWSKFGYRFRTNFDGPKGIKPASDWEAVDAAQLFADHCKLRIDELCKAHRSEVD